MIGCCFERRAERRPGIKGGNWGDSLCLGGLVSRTGFGRELGSGSGSDVDIDGVCWILRLIDVSGWIGG